MSTETWTLLLTAVSAAALVGSLLAVGYSNHRLAVSYRLDTLQRMVVEMNEVRRYRADHPTLERSLFEEREQWSDERIQAHMTAVQLANILEWAYLARRAGLLDRDVWESWLDTWSIVIARSHMLEAFTPNVWTFGRDSTISADLNKLVEGGSCPDPYPLARFRRTGSAVRLTPEESVAVSPKNRNS